MDLSGGDTRVLAAGPGNAYVMCTSTVAGQRGGWLRVYHAVVGSVADGTTVTISCHANGTTHTGRWGTTAVWNRLTDGTWISDAFVYTGTPTIGPTC